MKKKFLILSVLVVCLHFSSVAQKSKVGFFAGSVFSNLRGTVDAKDLNGKAKVGFTGGLVVDAPISNHISFYPVLSYVQKGTITQKPKEPTIKDRKSTELRYADIAANFIYNSNTKINWLIGAGPYGGFNLPSKFLTKSPNDLKSETEVTFGNTVAENYKGIDYGVNFLTGMRFKCGVFISANYSLGIRNLLPDGSLSKGDIKNNYFGVNLGWLINNK